MTELEGLVKTPLFSLHQQLGARMVPFAGWALPLEYAGTVAEHEAVRSTCGVFDVSHLGTVFVEGPDAEAVVLATFTNDVRELDDGASQYTLCCDERGGIVDDLIVYRIDGERYLAVPNAANTREVVRRLQAAAADRDARVVDESTAYAIVAVQGPRSLDLVRRLFPDVVDRVPYHHLGHIEGGPSDDGWLCRTGYTGEVGCELVLTGLDAPGVFRELVDLGAEPAGLGARDTLRLEMGYPLHGNDLTTDTDPFEARLGWAVHLEDRDFPGAPVLWERRERAPARKLWGIRAADRGIPRPGMAVAAGGRQVGTVTSGSFSPTLRTGIGLAYLERGLGPGDEVTVDVRGRDVRFEVVRPPFVDRDPRG